MLVPVVLFTLSAALVSHAQSTANNPQLGIQAIEAHFTNAGIVPSLLKQFSPSALMTLSYNGVGQVQPGQNLTVDQVKPFPQLSITPANSSVSLSENYTLAMVDADVVGTDESSGQTRHWLVNDVTVSGSTVSTENAINITDYASPLPPSGSGAHRYVVILYAQPAAFSPPGDLAQPNQPVGIIDLNQYVTSSKLGPVVAATYFDVQQGASPSVSATSPVVTSTLAAAATATSSRSASASATPSAASGKNSASASYNLNTGLASLLAFVGFIVAA
ncbi:phosphatidylethanolamine-binding protein [Gautieria morchelliformis]|nr:phosphatidylethanolamine-binding protein [Gautieria morchelliformis]